MKRGFQRVVVLLFICGCLPLMAGSLTLSEAERLAISTSPELQRFKSSSHALHQQAIADAQLSDPQLIIGAANVPTNSFNFNQDDMTMEQIGLQQTFARGNSLLMKSKQSLALAVGEKRKAQEKALTLLRNVRETWLDLYYWTQALHILQNNQAVYKDLLQVAISQYETGKAKQSDVLQMQLEISRLDDQAIQIKQQLDVLHAQLERWIGNKQTNHALILSLPHWPEPPPLKLLQNHLKRHPLLSIDAAVIAAAHSDVAFAKEQYKPGYILNVGYAKRQGHFVDGMTRPDFVGAQVTIDLPVFPANRQDRQMQASYNRLIASTLDQQIHYRDLLQILQTQYSTWKRLHERETLYKKQLIPELRQNAQAALKAFQNAKGELGMVLRIYSSELTTQLEYTQLQVDRAKSRAILLYLEGTAVC